GSASSSYLPTPTDLSALGNNKVIDFDIGSGHAFALDDAGQVWAWGTNYYGELGNGTTSSTHVLSPIAVDLSPLAGVAVRSVAVGGNYYSLLLDEAGNIWTWGYNEQGQLGPGDKLNRSLPTKVN